MKDILCAIKTFVLSIVTARDVVVAAVFLGLGLAGAHFYYKKGKRDSKKSYNHLIEHTNALSKKVTDLSQQSQEQTKEIQDMKQLLLALHASGQPVSQDVVVKVDTLAATAKVLEVSVADIVKISDEVTATVVGQGGIKIGGRAGTEGKTAEPS